MRATAAGRAATSLRTRPTTRSPGAPGRSSPLSTSASPPRFRSGSPRPSFRAASRPRGKLWFSQRLAGSERLTQPAAPSVGGPGPIKERHMARMPLAEESDLSGYIKELHDGAGEDDWATRHVARVFEAHPEVIEQYLDFYYPWHSNAEGGAEPPTPTRRRKELMRLRIAVLNGCVTCQSARLAAETVPEDQATGVWADDFPSTPPSTPPA